jgi:hypothetical protein
MKPGALHGDGVGNGLTDGVGEAEPLGDGSEPTGTPFITPERTGKIDSARIVIDEPMI